MARPLASAILLILIPFASTSSRAQTTSVLHTFSGPDGEYPYGTLTMDRAGNLYGTTLFGGSGCGTEGCGTVFKLTHKNSGWILTRLYSFTGGHDGEYPMSGVTIGPDGSLYGTTSAGGGGPCTAPPSGGGGCGTVFNLRPPATACGSVNCLWTETVLHRFAGGSDGAYPGFGNVIFDQTGDLYGTTEGDVAGNNAIVFELTHSSGGWTKSLVYNFANEFVGSGVIFDAAGNLYGTTGGGGIGWGSVYKLSPSGVGWTETTLYAFQNHGDGYDPLGGVVFDQAGNLFGTTFNDGGRVYELSPSNGGWTYSSLYFFDGYEGSFSAPTVDSAGNVYGTMSPLPGTVFELVRSNGSQEINLYSPELPVGGVVLDANGNIYGTDAQGGDGRGTIFEITP